MKVADTFRDVVQPWMVQETRFILSVSEIAKLSQWFRTNVWALVRSYSAATITTLASLKLWSIVYNMSVRYTFLTSMRQENLSSKMAPISLFVIKTSVYIL